MSKWNEAVSEDAHTIFTVTALGVFANKWDTLTVIIKADGRTRMLNGATKTNALRTARTWINSIRREIARRAEYDAALAVARAKLSS